MKKKLKNCSCSISPLFIILIQFLKNLRKAWVLFVVSIIVSVLVPFPRGDLFLYDLNSEIILIFLFYESVFTSLTFFLIRLLSKKLQIVQDYASFQFLRFCRWVVFFLLFPGIFWGACVGVQCLESSISKLIVIGFTGALLGVYVLRVSWALYMYALTNYNLKRCIYLSWQITQGKVWFIFKVSIVPIMLFYFIPGTEFLWFFPFLYELTLFNYLKDSCSPVK